MTNRHALVALLLLATAAPAQLTARHDDEKVPLLPSAPEHLEHVGFALVDCGYDDPTDGIPKTNYLDEVAGFSNLAQLCPTAVDEDLGPRLDAMVDVGVRGLLSVDGVLFDVVPDPSSPSGLSTSLNPQYASRWATFRAANAHVFDAEHLAAISLVDEPTWNGVAPAELAAAAALVDATLPDDVALLVIEAAPVVADLVVPDEIDWLAFDRYGTLDPVADPAFQADLAMLKSKRTRPDQRIALIAECQWLDLYAPYGVTPADMGGVYLAYHALAVDDPDVVAIVGYLWPGGFDAPTQLGARQLPKSAQKIIRAVGQSIVER